MKNCFGIILIFSILEVFAQTPPEFIFDRQNLTVKRDSNSSDDLKVYRGQISKRELHNLSPILGTTIKEETILRFVPLVPFGWNQKYTFVYDNTLEYFTNTIPETYKYLSVQTIYPSSKQLPSNLLKLYIKFSQPINETNVYDHIQFMDIAGDTLSRASLPLNNALISNDGTLLTIWIEPGRQKRGLIPNKQLGPVFEKNNTYKLVILKSLKNKEGVPMLQDFVHSFLITTADRLQPNIDSWKIIPPKTNIENLHIHCFESLDYGSTLSNITVLTTEKKEVLGDWQLIQQESLLVFTPLLGWKPGDYEVLFNANLEDLAGNNLDRLFDSEIKESLDRHRLSKEYTMKFAIRYD